MMADRFTEADFKTWRFKKDAMHFNGGRAWFGWGHACINQPRLMVLDKYVRADRKATRIYVVDGDQDFATLDEALAALSVPPTVSLDDALLLLELPPDGAWTQVEGRGRFLLLACKGLVEWGRDADDKVTIRLTEPGRAARPKQEDPS